MCREYRFEVKPLLRASGNEIRIVLQPAVTEAARRAREYPYEVPAMQVRPRLRHRLIWSAVIKPYISWGCFA